MILLAAILLFLFFLLSMRLPIPYLLTMCPSPPEVVVSYVIVWVPFIVYVVYPAMSYSGVVVNGVVL